MRVFSAYLVDNQRNWHISASEGRMQGVCGLNILTKKLTHGFISIIKISNDTSA